MSDRDPSRQPLEQELAQARQRIEALEDEAERYRALIDNAAESFVVVQDGSIVFQNPAFAAMVTVRSDTVSSVPFLDFVHPDDRQGLFERYLQAMGDDEPASRHQFRTVTPQGDTRWYSIGAAPLRWQARPALLCSLIEITAERRAAQALEESEAKYRLLVKSAPAAIYEVDLSHGRFLTVNDAMCELLGYSRSELMSLHPVDILSEKSRELMAKRMAAHMRNEPVPNTVEFEVRTKDGRLRWALLNQKLLRDEDGTLRAAVVAHDITVRRLLEEELQKVQKLESLGVLAGGIAHDFNNLLTAVVGSLSLARHVAGDAGKVSAHCDAAARACVRAQDLTAKLLTFSDGGTPVKQPTTVQPLVDECTRLSVGGSSLDCSVDLPADLWPLHVDQAQIAQVLNNLLINAAQAMPEGGALRIAASNVDIATTEDLPLLAGPYVRISVADEGTGIAPEHLSKIFDPFFSTKETGSGLGLAAAHSIVQRHGGQLSVESVPSVGSTFVLYLPASDAPASARDHDEAAPQGPAGRVLLMDDDAVVRAVGSQMLEELGCEVVCARDGAEAVEAFKLARAASRPFDLVVMDLTVRGGMGGAEGIRRIREIDPVVKALVASGYATDPVLAHPRRYGFDAALPKPFSLEQLDQVVTSIRGE